MLYTEFSRQSASMNSASLEVDEVDCGYILSLNLYNKGNWEKVPIVTSGLRGSIRPTMSNLLFFKKIRLLLIHKLYQQNYHFLEFRIFMPGLILRSSLYSWLTLPPPTLQLETHSKATPEAHTIFQSQFYVIVMFPRAVGTRALLGVLLHVHCLPGCLNVEGGGRKAKEDLWPWEVPPGSCLRLRHASPGIFSNIQHTWEVVACRVSLAASVLPRDGADCWQVIKAGTAAEKWHLQTRVQVQSEP